MNQCDSLVFLTIIAGRKQKDDLLTALHSQGVHLANTSYGKGTVKASLLQCTLGLVPEHNKAVIVGITTSEKTGAVLDMLREKFHFDRPNTGIAFTLPIDKLSF